MGIFSKSTKTEDGNSWEYYCKNEKPFNNSKESWQYIDTLLGIMDREMQSSCSCSLIDEIIQNPGLVLDSGTMFAICVMYKYRVDSRFNQMAIDECRKRFFAGQSFDFTRDYTLNLQRIKALYSDMQRKYKDMHGITQGNNGREADNAQQQSGSAPVAAPTIPGKQENWDEQWEDIQTPSDDSYKKEIQYKAQIQQLNVQLNQLKSDNESLQNQNNRVQQENYRVRQDYNKVQQDYNRVQQELTQARSEIDKFKSDAEEEAQKLIHTYLEQYQSDRQQEINQSIDTKLNDQNGKFAEAEEWQNDMSGRVSKLQATCVTKMGSIADDVILNIQEAMDEHLRLTKDLIRESTQSFQGKLNNVITQWRASLFNRKYSDLADCYAHMYRIIQIDKPVLKEIENVKMKTEEDEGSHAYIEALQRMQKRFDNLFSEFTVALRALDLYPFFPTLGEAYDEIRHMPDQVDVPITGKVVECKEPGIEYRGSASVLPEVIRPATVIIEE